MPDNKVLEKVKHHKEKFTNQKKIKYFVSYVLKEWEPEKAKLTKVVLEATFTFDIKEEMIFDDEGNVTKKLSSTKYPDD